MKSTVISVVLVANAVPWLTECSCRTRSLGLPVFAEEMGAMASCATEVARQEHCFSMSDVFLAGSFVCFRP